MKKTTLNEAINRVDDDLILEAMEPNHKIAWHISKTAIGVVVAAELVIAAVGIYALTRHTKDEIVNPGSSPDSTVVTDLTNTTAGTDATETSIVTDPNYTGTTDSMIYTTHPMTSSGESTATGYATPAVPVAISERYGNICYNPDLKENYPAEILKWDFEKQKYEIIQDSAYFDQDKSYSREKAVEFVGEVSGEVFDALMESEQTGNDKALDAVAVEHFDEILGLALNISQYDTACSDTIKRVLHCDDLPDGGQALYGAIVQKYYDVETAYESCYEANGRTPSTQALDAIFEEYGFFIAREYDWSDISAAEKAYLDKMNPYADLDWYSAKLNDLVTWYEFMALDADKPQFPALEGNSIFDDEWENWVKGTFGGDAARIYNNFVSYCVNDDGYMPIGFSVAERQHTEKVYEKAKKVQSYSDSDFFPEDGEVQVEVGQKTGQPLQIPNGKQAITRVIADDNGSHKGDPHGVVENLIKTGDSQIKITYQYRLVGTSGTTEVSISNLTMTLLGETIE